MLLLRVQINGQAASNHLVTDLPVLLGRSPQAQVRIDAPGVWDQHATIHLDQGKFILKPSENALVLLNGATVAECPLKNGDLLSLGGCEVMFSLSPPTQASLAGSEAAAWTLIALSFLLEIGLLLALS